MKVNIIFQVTYYSYDKTPYYNYLFEITEFLNKTEKYIGFPCYNEVKQALQKWLRENYDIDGKNFWNGYNQVCNNERSKQNKEYYRIVKNVTYEL